MKLAGSFRNIAYLYGMLLIAAHTQAQGQVVTADPLASKETRALFANLYALNGRSVMFGHQDALAYGVGWEYEADRSDVKSVTGSYPSVYGWDLGHLELDSLKDLDGVPFSATRRFVKEIYERGGISTFSWHFTNPFNKKTAWDTTSTASVREILPGGSAHARYKTYLDKVARFFKSLKTRDGVAIPVIFRPFHEHTGSWFWWGEKLCTPEEFKDLWRFTVDYLTKTQHVHQLLIAYSAADFDTKEAFLARYPGNYYIDVLGFDIYAYKNMDEYQKKLNIRLGLLTEIAKENNKIPALTETGYETIPSANWWTNVLLPALKKYPVSYVLVWRNAHTGHFYAPYPGQQSAADFKEFYEDPFMMFQDKLTPLNIYKAN